MNLNREEVVQSALNVQRWCEEHIKQEDVCDCPFGYRNALGLHCCFLYAPQYPMEMELDEFLRTRGVKENKIEEQKKKAKPWECHDCRYFPCLENEDKPHRATCEHFELW